MCGQIQPRYTDKRKCSLELTRNSKLKTHRTVYFLIITNIFTLITLIVVSLHYDQPIKLLNRLFQSSINSNYRYTENPNYEVRRNLFKVYKPEKINIVMLGDSITYQVDWNELLSKTDIANRGIDFDVTEGLLNRLSGIYELNPDICFIMVGINDIIKDIPLETIFLNYTKIINGIHANNIIPIVQSTLYVSTKKNNWKKLNKKVDDLNALLHNFTIVNGVRFVDTNKGLSENGALNPSYTYDGVHLLGNGYEKWKGLISKELSIN
jgi:lysophospholipase L1-like esterase